jgi:hypothetical protein
LTIFLWRQWLAIKDVQSFNYSRLVSHLCAQPKYGRTSGHWNAPAGVDVGFLLGDLVDAAALSRWERINADGSRVVIVLRPASVTGRQQVR